MDSQFAGTALDSDDALIDFKKYRKKLGVFTAGSVQ